MRSTHSLFLLLNKIQVSTNWVINGKKLGKDAIRGSLAAKKFQILDFKEGKKWRKGKHDKTKHYKFLLLECIVIHLSNLKIIILLGHNIIKLLIQMY